MQNKGKLYLIPSFLGNNPANQQFPANNIEIANTLNEFIVEDERTARRFLKAAGYIHPIDQITFHLLNEHTKPLDIINYLDTAKKGGNMGLLSDAGCPGVADPGADIVAIAQQQNITICPLIGPTSIILALMASGFNGQQFKFHGYLPVDKSLRQKKIKELEKNIKFQNETQIFIEAPYRNDKLIADILQTCDKDIKLCIGCDIAGDTEYIKTKTVQEWAKNTPGFHKRPVIFLLYK